MRRGLVYGLTCSGWLFAVLYTVYILGQSPSASPATTTTLTGGLYGEGRACPQGGFASFALNWMRVDGSRPMAVCLNQNGGVDGNDDVLKDIRYALPRAFISNEDRLCRVFYDNFPSLKPYEASRELEARVLRLRGGDVVLFKAPAMVGAGGHLPDEVIANRDGFTFYGAVGRSSDGLKFVSCEIEEELKPRASPPIWVMMHRDSKDSPFLQRAKQYAQKQGYGFLLPGSSCTISSLPRSWLKLALLRHFMLEHRAGQGSDDDAGWILWLDSVALITNMDTRVETFLELESARKALLLVSSDVLAPVLANVGVLLARHSVDGAALIDSIWRAGVARDLHKPKAFYWDQNAMNYLLQRAMGKREFHYWLQGLRVLPHRSLSSFMRSGAKNDLVAGHWKHGDFIALITGPSESDAYEQAKLLLRSRGKGDEEPLYWLQSGKLYEPPQTLWVPFAFSLPLDSYFSMSKPNFLSFPHRTPGTQTSTPINPTCLWANDEESELYCVVRTINYRLDIETGKYLWPSRGKTVNMFFSLNAETVLEEEGTTIVVNAPEEMLITLPVQSKLRPVLTEGFEDVKLIRYKNQVFGVCTSLQTHPKGNCEIVMLALAQNRVDEVTPMRGFKPNACHKNWMAFELDNVLHFIETADPLTVVTPKLPQGQVSPLYVDSKKRYTGLKLRGTSAGIPFHEGHLFVVHETIKRGQEYAHRFMYLAGGPTFPIRQLSKPFFVIRKTVEFLIGIMMPKDKKRLLLCFGFEDSVPAFSVLTIESPKAFLERKYFWM